MNQQLRQLGTYRNIQNDYGFSTFFDVLREAYEIHLTDGKIIKYFTKRAHEKKVAFLCENFTLQKVQNPD